MMSAASCSPRSTRPSSPAHPGVTIDQSHAGTSAQARAIAEGLGADVVTFNQVTDIDFLVKKGLVSADWQKDFPNNASPFYSLPSFLVRAGNPKNIKDWNDLVRDDVQVIFPNPKTSGNARYTYLAATAYAKESLQGRRGQGEGVRHQAVRQRAGLRHRRPRRDHHLRRARDRRRADHLRVRDARHPQGVSATTSSSRSRRRSACSPSSRWRSSTRSPTSTASRDLAKAYLDFLYTPEGQKIVAENGNRVHDAAVAAEYKDDFPEVRLVTVEEVFGGWDKVQKEHFAAGGLLDQTYGSR